ncbi:uncharacterized protein LOC124923729 [Impatiens glandulifera]|uniref:uncharacterized protein LOC124923729 n=1 Tax=Impatiens glandulifera TaxID=253017 RepID=UPI001FB0637F|nr:uncharacterized protein LOC124923729 [Impatiens glandulifera]
MESKLQEAAIKGEVDLLLEILDPQHDPLALDRIQLGGLNHTPLHIAAFHGHTPFVTKILELSPGLALVLDHRRWSPLRMAVSKGHVEIVKALVDKKPEMCSVVDEEGNNPLHLAAIMGRKEVLDELMKVRWDSALEVTTNRESILHLCVKHDKEDCLKLLLEKFSDDPEFINVVDRAENNILHRAVKFKQFQIIECILGQNIKVDINATNAMGLTPLDILSRQNHVMNEGDLKIKNALTQVGAKRNKMYGKVNWLPKRRDSLMVVASLIATMTFAAGLNPPGGVWKDTQNGHRVGEAIVAYNYKDSYKWYLRFNTIAFVSSLSIILILISGLPLRQRKFMWALQVIMWMTITMVAFSYSYALVAVTPKKDRLSLKRTLICAITAWCIVMALVLLGNAIRLFMKWMKGKGKYYWDKIHINRSIIRCIINQNTKVNINATNAMGLTPLDILSQQNHHMIAEDLEIRDTLMQVGAKRKNILGNIDWLSKRRDSLMVVASLIATMAFAAGINPPGGVWQDTEKDHHRAGEAIVAYNYKDSYKWYLRFNTIASVSSLSIILILISGLPLKNRKFMWALQIIMWLTITAVAICYSYALVAVTPTNDRESLTKTLIWAIASWCFMMALVLLGNGIRLVMKWVKGKSMDYLERHRHTNQRRLGETRSINMRNQIKSMDPILENASTKGNISLLHQTLAQDPLSLDKFQIGDLIKTPLHIAAFHGHLPFIEETLRLRPNLSLILDRRRRSALHVAAYEGRSDVVRVLIQSSPEMCGVLDDQGRNPFHLAVVMGREKVLSEMLLVLVGNAAVRDRTGSGEGIVGICVKYDRFECLKLLLEKIKDVEFVNVKDATDDGNNVFHQAVKYKRIQMINYLITQQIKVDINATNAMGLTPLDILLQENNVNDFEIRDILRQAGAMKADEIHSSMPKSKSYFNNVASFSGANSIEQIRHESQNSIFGSTDWLPKRRDSLMIVASLIATMAFSAGLTPPGGVWSDHLSREDNGGGVKYEIPHRAGEAIIAYNYPLLYKFYIRTNTIAYVSSLSIILIMISGLPLRHRRYMWALQVVMWVTITAMGFTYAFVLSALTPKKNVASLKRTLVVAVLVWCIVMALVFIGNALRLAWKWVKRENIDGVNINQVRSPIIEMT